MALQASLEKAKLVPGSAETLIPEDFQPTTTLKVDFGGKAVEFGNLLRVSEVKTAPSVSFAAEVKVPSFTSLPKLTSSAQRIAKRLVSPSPGRPGCTYT
jgi:hypothetical protein